MENVKFKASDGEILNCYLFLPKGEAKGIVQIVHGLEEHALRYRKFAKFLNGNGYLVFASDQRLHGKTAGENLSITNIKDVFPIMVEDQTGISDMLLDKFNLPLIIFGHSFGSFIVQRYVQIYNKHTGVILSGSAYMKRLETFAAMCLSWSFVKLKGGEEDSKLIEKLVISSFNKPFSEGESWISANKENVEEYENDPLCGKPLCANFYYSMFKNTRDLYSDAVLSQIDKNKRIFLASGKDDPVGKQGKSITKLHETYLAHGINSKLKLYDNFRHEILNEGDKTVMLDMLEEIENMVEGQNCIEKTE